MLKYMRKCEFPHAEIHVERCITACGYTLNQVQKIVQTKKQPYNGSVAFKNFDSQSHTFLAFCFFNLTICLASSTCSSRGLLSIN